MQIQSVDPPQAETSEHAVGVGIQLTGQQGCSFTFEEFARIGIPLTIEQTLVYGFYLVWA